MRKLIIVLMVLFSASVIAQSNARENEAKVNLLNVIAFKWLDVSYQRNLNEESAFGVSFLTRLSSENKNDYNRSFSITPYYRYYFSNDDAIGFFGEVHTKINGGDKLIAKATETEDAKFEKYTDLSIGLAGGIRYASDKGFVGEIYAGAGRNMLSENSPHVVPRLGISIGYGF